MWLILGSISIVATFINLYMYRKGKDYKLPMALGLSFTALTLCAEQSMVAGWIKDGDVSALLDVVPTMEIVLWILVIISIVLNMTPIFLDFISKRK